MTEPARSQPPPEDQIGYLLVRIAHRLSQHWTRDLAAYGLTARQHGVLATLAARPGVSANALARSVMITAQSMGDLLTGLQDRGLIARQPPAGRGRPARLALTDEGHRVLAAVEPVTEAHNSPAALGLTEADAVQLRTLLQKILAAEDPGQDRRVSGIATAAASTRARAPKP